MKNIKNYLRIVLSLMVVWTLGIGVSLNAQKEKIVDTIDVPLSKPGAPVFLEVKLMNNDLNISGYSGKNVLVEVVNIETLKKLNSEKSRERRERSRERVEERGERAEKKKNDKAKGMFKISNPGITLSVEEEGNHVVIKNNTYSSRKSLLIRVKVPFKTSVKLSLMNGGTILVNGLVGDHVVKHHNGSIKMTNISGSVVANTMNGEVTVAFNKISLNKPMAFSSFNGDVDVTLPGNSKFKLKLKTNRGEIYSDYKLIVDKNSSKSRKTVDKSDSGKFKVKFDNTVYATLNGGGEELFCKTWNGNIYIRKKK